MCRVAMHEMIADLPPKARVVLREIAAADGPVTTRDLTERTGYANNTVGYHAQQLIDEGFVEHVGKTDIGAARPANQYRLDAAGHEVIESIDADEIQGDVGDLAERVQVLEEKVDSMHQAMLKLHSRVDELEAESR